ncbi:MAG: VapC toxin family PIN domain ribonuclease [Pseudonocardiales bacterium]|nr:VapC toxin family PIN domain ribonuclease [Pseudonocardiales bacterium]
MSTFVLDTCALIDLGVVELGEYADGIAAVTSITIGELAFGVDLGDPAQQTERSALLRSAITDHEILTFGVEEARLYGVMAALVRAAARSPRPRRLDLQIAATAAAARLPLLTTNPKDFVGTDRLVDIVPLTRATR